MFADILINMADSGRTAHVEYSGRACGASHRFTLIRSCFVNYCSVSTDLNQKSAFFHFIHFT